jgi:hypothetical protein
MMKTEGSSRRSTSTSSMRPSAAPGAMRRSRGPRSGSSPSATSSTAGTPRTSAPNCGTCTTPGQQGREHPRVSAFELDRAGCVAIHPPGKDPDRPALLRQGAAGGEPRRRVDHGRRRAPAAGAGREARDETGSLPHARLLSADRRRGVARATTLPRSFKRCC